MARIINYQNVAESLTVNEIEDKKNYFKYYHLLNMLHMAASKRFPLYDCYNVVDDPVGNAMCVHVTGNYFIYADDWSPVMIPLLLERINFNRFTNYTFMGACNFVLELFSEANQQYTMMEDRLLYIAENVNAADSIPKNLISWARCEILHNFLLSPHHLHMERAHQKIIN